MHTSMPIGIDDFAKVRSDYYFVDKTAFLGAFLKNHAQVTLFTRPRRFGKTLTLSMMRYFLDIEGAETNRPLFDGLAIEDDPAAMAEQGTRPVLFLTLKGWKGLTWDVLQVRVRQQLGDLFSAHDAILSDDLKAYDRRKFQGILDGTGDFAALSDALAFLLRLMESHYGKKPVLLLDEYDVPIQSAWEHGYYDEAIDFFREFYSAALKTNPSLDFAVMTGVLRIAKENIFSALNNLKVDSVLQMKYPEAFGFTMAEVEKITHDLGCDGKMEELREWYDGYHFAGKEIYNPWSVVNYFDSGCHPRAYWVHTSGNAILGEMLRHAKNRTLDELESVMQGGNVRATMQEDFIYSEIYRNQDALYTLLVTTGYLTTEHVEEDDLGIKAELVIPNREIRALFRREVLGRYRNDDMEFGVEELMRAFLAGDLETVREGLAQYLESLTSSFDAAKGRESFYHGFVLGMIAVLMGDYIIRSNRESGYGRYDIAAFPKAHGDCGMVIECKTAEREEDLAARAQEALAQIEEKDYLADFRTRGIESVHRYGIAFCGKKVRVAYQE